MDHSNSCAVNAALAADIISLTAFYRIIGAPDPASSTLHISLAISRYEQQWQISWHPRVLVFTLYSRHPAGLPFPYRSPCLHLQLQNRAYQYPLPSRRPICPRYGCSLRCRNRTIINTQSHGSKQDTHRSRHGHAVYRLHSCTEIAPAANPALILSMEHHPGMIIVTPTMPWAGWQIERPEVDLKSGISDGDTTQSTMEYVWMANFLGMPALSVPAGFVGAEGENRAGCEVDEGGTSVGLMGMGDWGSEENLLEWGAQAEAVGTDRRRKPEIWVDVLERARVEMQSVGGEGKLGDKGTMRKRR
ncbi:hypothetical protein BDR22DRAFT_503950 [Usnea florida]